MPPTPSRSRGRPNKEASEALARHIVETAAGLFAEQGYAKTSLDQVAAVSGSGKMTLYRRFGSKEALFLEVIEQGVRALTGLVEAASPQPENALAALRRRARELFDFVLAPRVLGLQRIIVAETARFPRLGEHVLETAMAPFQAAMEALIGIAISRGDLRPGAAAETYRMLNALVAGYPSVQALMGASQFASREGRDHYFDAAWRFFLAAAGTAVETDPPG